ncbi:kinetochore protein spc24 [Nematostella vectensis]|uniref:kinetochore protein spc24 n=1 Tax=Nematostella vectensis TaxID=45351 RepID=UPI0020770704|nr:kinetochore protein spc24 [Nematostella vectensis]
MSNPNLNLINEITTILASNDDAEAVENAAVELNEVIHYRKLEQEEIFNSIRQLTAKTESDSEKLLKLDGTSQNRTIGELKTATKKLSSEIKGIETEIKLVEHGIGESKKMLEEKRKEQESETSELLPKTKYNFKLYTNISHIRWNYESEDDHIAGFIACLKNVKPFDLNAKQNSEYFIANYLWDMIETSID